ncbi:MAG: hypothetical protein ABI880_15035 [Acidobacteriota bacterium]
MTTTTEYNDEMFRAALRSEARRLVVTLEARGVAFRLQDGKMQGRPTRLVTADERAAFRHHAENVRVLVARRRDWSDWWTRPEPRFDPSTACLTPAEIRGRTA